jgi:hypothetical protein
LTTSLYFSNNRQEKDFALGDNIDHKAKLIHNAFGRYTILFENNCLHNVKKNPLFYL